MRPHANIQHVRMSDISAGQQKTLTAFEMHVVNTERLSQVRGKRRKAGRKSKRRRDRRTEGRKKRWKGQEMEATRERWQRVPK